MEKRKLILCLVAALVFGIQSYVSASGGWNVDCWIDGIGEEYNHRDEYTDATDVYFWVYAHLENVESYEWAIATGGTSTADKEDKWMLTVYAKDNGSVWDWDYHDSRGRVWGACRCLIEDNPYGSAESEAELEWE